MSFAISGQIFEKFKGIRERNGVNSAGSISAVDAVNVELVQTEIADGTGIKSMNGNTVVYKLPEGFKVLGIFKSVQENIIYKFIYAENDVKGALFYINLTGEPEIVVDNLSVTGECSGLTMTSSAYDVFVFTNGCEAKTVCFTSDELYGEAVRTIEAEDYLGRKITWLSMCEWNGFLVVASPFGVHASHQNDIYVWNDDPQDVADSWYIDFGKKTTAVFSFSNGLYIFTQDDISYLSTTPNDTANSVLMNAGMNGCFSYQSVVKHDTFLFFYDNNQKNIYYLQILDTGQTRPAGPVALEIQSYFSDISSFKMYSCIYNNRNEIWCLINGDILIFDYARQEWIMRQEQKISAVALIQNRIYSGGDEGKVFVENINNDFDGKFFPAVYKTTYINSIGNSNLKKQKTPLLLVLNDEFVNDFWVELTCDSKIRQAKRIRVTASGGGVYADDSLEIVTPSEELFDCAVFAAENTYAKKVVEITTPQTWYNIAVKIYTDSPEQGFYITSMELKNIWAKTKTKGR